MTTVNVNTIDVKKKMGLICPYCKHKLDHPDGEFYNCGQCRTTFDIIASIPDFRISDPPYITREKERQRVERLFSHFDDLSYEDLVRYYVYEIEDHKTEAARQKDLQHRLTLRKRAFERQQDAMDMLKKNGYSLKNGVQVLDLGCGSAESMVGFLKAGFHVVGFDISYEELILGKKLCLEDGFDSALFVAGNAEALPFMDSSFHFIYSMDVIEHVIDQSLYLAQTQRVLRNKGAIFFNSPNRLSLLAPEPHVGLWFMGYLPRFLMDPYCRRRGKGPYIGKRLLSYWELKRIVKKTYKEIHVFKRKPNPQASSIGGKLFRLFAPFSVWVYCFICEIHSVLAKKS